MVCSNCGAKLADGAMFCFACGKKRDDAPKTENDSYGKNKCRLLREIRKTIAQTNNVDIHFAECTHEGPCSGTCPACDREISELNAALKAKVMRNEAVFLPDVTVDHREIIPQNLRMVPSPANMPVMGMMERTPFEEARKPSRVKRFPWKK